MRENNNTVNKVSVWDKIKKVFYPLRRSHAIYPDGYEDLKEKAFSSLLEIQRKVSHLDMNFIAQQDFTKLIFTHKWEQFHPNFWGKELYIEGYSPSKRTILAVKAVKEHTYFPPHFHPEEEYVQVFDGALKIRYGTVLTKDMIIPMDDRYWAKSSDVILNNEVILEPGDSMKLLPYQPHDVEVLTDETYYFIHWVPPLPSTEEAVVVEELA